MSRHDKPRYCKVCGNQYRPCVGCHSENIAITPRKHTCSNECFVEFVLMVKGESDLIRIIFKDDERLYLIEKINKKTIKLKGRDGLIKPEEILAVTYCPIEKLNELAKLFKNEEEECNE